MLGVTAKGKKISKKREPNAYAATEWVQFENKYMRYLVGNALFHHGADFQKLNRLTVFRYPSIAAGLTMLLLALGLIIPLLAVLSSLAVRWLTSLPLLPPLCRALSWVRFAILQKFYPHGCLIGFQTPLSLSLKIPTR